MLRFVKHSSKIRVKDAIQLLADKGYDITKAVGRSRSSKTLACTSDLHTGSIYALCSEEPIRQETGEVFKRRAHNKLFLDHWNEVRDWMRKADIQITNGEPFNGSNPKEQGHENWTSDMVDQVNDSARLLKRFNPKYFMFTRGSNYHVKSGQTNYEELLAQKLNTLPYSGYFLNPRHKVKHGKTELYEDKTRYVDNYIWFLMHGKLINFTHHVGFSKRYYYRSTPIAAEMANLEFDRGYYYAVNQNLALLGRGHVHYYVEVRHPSSIGFTTPAWKLPDGHLFRGGLSGTRPNVGGVKVVIEQNGEIIVDKLLMKKKFPRPFCPDLSDI